MEVRLQFDAIVKNPVYLQVADRLREAILDGDIAPGDVLPTERELSTQFGVSRPTVREALRALQAQGLISGGGRSVVESGMPTGPLREALGNLVRLQRVSLRDLIQLRCALETEAIRHAASGSRVELSDAAAALEDMRRPGISVAEFDEADVRFHVALIAASGNEAMRLIILSVRDAIAAHLYEALSQDPDAPARMAGLIDEHEAILQATKRGDMEQAVVLLRSHIEAFYRQFVINDGRSQRRGSRRGGREHGPAATRGPRP